MSLKHVDFISPEDPPRGTDNVSISICSLSSIILGILLLLVGGYISFVYFTEITPPNYEAHYQRYVGSSFPRVAGEYRKNSRII